MKYITCITHSRALRFVARPPRRAYYVWFSSYKLQYRDNAAAYIAAKFNLLNNQILWSISFVLDNEKKQYALIRQTVHRNSYGSESIRSWTSVRASSTNLNHTWWVTTYEPHHSYHPWTRNAMHWCIRVSFKACMDHRVPPQPLAQFS